MPEGGSACRDELELHDSYEDQADAGQTSEVGGLGVRGQLTLISGA